MTYEAKIEQIEAYACSIPLDQPINLGTYKVTAREYAVVKIRVSGGLYGAAVGLTRKTPVDVTVLDVLASGLIGVNAFDIVDCRTVLDRTTRGLEQFGIIGRARSLLDIALHDIRAKVIGVPLWRLLGGQSQPVEVLLVEGYKMSNESEGGVVDRLLERVDQGYKRLKIEIGSYVHSSELALVLASFRRQASDTKLVLDALWRWNTAEEATRFLAPLREFDIDWVEDPFPLEQVDSYRRLSRAKTVRIGAGDDMTNQSDVESLLDAPVDVLRLDATTIGGVTAFCELAARAKRRGMYVSPHFYPQIHQHCAFGLGFLDHVEMIPTDRPFDRTHDLIQNDAFKAVKKGLLYPPSELGAGYQLDDKAVERWARRRGVVSC